MERYTCLFQSPERLYVPSSPLVIETAVLLKGNQTGSILMQVKFRNLGAKTILAVKIEVQAFDVSKNKLDGVQHYTFLDLAAVLGEEFGADQAIPMPNPSTRSYTFTIAEVIFSDSSEWRSVENACWAQLPKQDTLVSLLKSHSLVEQYRRETAFIAQYQPITNEDLWLCCCGTPNKNTEAVCSHCYAAKDKAFTFLDKEILKSGKYKFDQETQEQRKQEQKYKRLKKAKIVVSASLLLMLALALVYFLLLL